MFKPGDTAYFVFRGNWEDGNYRGHFCLHLDYFPFMPVKIITARISQNYGEIYDTTLCGRWSWIIRKDCLEKEFSFDKFILAHLEWNKKMTAAQFQSILSTIGR